MVAQLEGRRVRVQIGLLLQIGLIVLAHKMIENSTLEILQNEWGHLFWIGADSNEPISKIKKFVCAK